MGVWDLARDTVRSFQRNGLPDLASAIAFQSVLAIVPFLLFLCALIGFLELEEIWREDVAPAIRDAVSTPVYRVINDAVQQVLRRREGWWLTAGLALTLWELSAATRVTMTALDRVYGCHRRRSLVQKLPRSLALGGAMGLCVVAAIAIVRLGPLVTGDLDGVLALVSYVVRWLLAVAVLGAGVGLLVHYGAATRQPVGWSSVGTGLVLVAWALTSIAFDLYVRYVASYESVFGHLATFFVLLIYVWLLANAFLAGVQLDACVRERA